MSITRIIESKNLSDAWYKIGDLFTKEEYSKRGPIEYFLYLYNAVIETESSDVFNLFLEDVGYTSKKITHLLKAYIDPDMINNCLRGLKETNDKWRLKGIFTDYSLQTKSYSKLVKGPCIIGASYKEDNHNLPILTIYSRSVEFPKKILADLLLISGLASLVKEALAIDKDIKIIWYTGTIWLKARIGARIYKIHKLPEEINFVNTNFQNMVQKNWDNLIVNQGEVSYNELKRVQKLYLIKKEGKLKKVLDSQRFLKIFKKYLRGDKND